MLAALCACSLVAGLVAAKTTRDALFLTNFPAALLPRMMTASAVASVAAVLLIARAMARRSPRRVLLAGLSVAIGLLLVEWALTFSSPRAAAILVHLHVALFGATLLSAFWSMINERFDPYTAKRVMGRIGAGAAMGGFVGGGFAWIAARSLSVPSMLLSVAFLNALALVCVRRLTPRAASPGAAAAPVPSVRLRHAVRILREGSYLRHLAWLVALGALLESLLDFTFNARAAETLGTGPELASFLALYQTGVGVLGLLAQGVLTRASLDALGLAGTVGVRPLAVAVSAFVGLLDPRLWSLLLARGAHTVLTTSLFRSSYELLFTPVPSERKRPTKTLIDVGFDKLGTVAGSLVALGAVSLFHADAVRVLLAVVVLTALLSLLVTSWLHAGYVGALEASLRSGAVRLEPDEVKDATTRFFYTRTGGAASILGLADTPGPSLPARRREDTDPVALGIADLRSGERARVLRALPPGTDPDPALVPFLIPLLARDAVLGEVVRALRRVAPRVVGQLTDALLDPRQDVVVRRRVPRVLVAVPTARTVDGLLRGLEEDAHFDVRARCGLALLRIRERHSGIAVPREAVFAAALRELQRDAAAGEGAAADDEASHDDVVEHVFTLLCLVLDREPMQIASRALNSNDRALIGTALEYLETVVPEELRRALWKRLQVGMGERAAARPSQEVLDELLKSSIGKPPPRSARRRRPGETG